MGEIKVVQFYKVRMCSPSEDKAVGFFNFNDAVKYINKRVEKLNHSRTGLRCSLNTYNIFEHPFMIGQVYDRSESGFKELPGTYISLETMRLDVDEFLSLGK